MPQNSGEGIEGRRTRLAALAEPKRFGELIRSLIPAIEQYLGEAAGQKRPVLRWQPPETATAHYQSILEKGDGEFPSLVASFLSGATQLQSPHNLGHQVAVPLLNAAALEVVSALSNQGSALFELSPASNGIEKAVMRTLCARAGWSDGDGITTHGGTVANLTAILAARNRAFPDAWEKGGANQGIVFASADAHYSMARALGIAGMGTAQLRKVPVDGERRMDVAALKKQMNEARAKGIPIVAVVASLCSTSVGSFDRLPPIADLCREHGVWLHVDGAHGAAVLFSKRYRGLFDGLSEADSLTWDAHKLLSVPGLVTFLLYRDKKQSYLPFQQEAPYLFDKAEESIAEFNAGLRTLECTRRAMAVSLWGVWSQYGDSIFEDLIEVNFETTQRFYQLLKETPDFEPFLAPAANILCFRHLPTKDRQEEIRRKLIQRGNFYITRTKLDGEVWLRVTIMNPATELSHLRSLLDEIRAAAS